LDEHERRKAAEAAAPSTTRASIQRDIGGLYTKFAWLLVTRQDGIAASSATSQATLPAHVRVSKLPIFEIS
jgi:hypothetical protein